MKKLLTVLTVITLLLTMAPVAMGGFSDAPKSNHWVYDNFMLVYNSGLLKGYPDGTFKGERYATRYEMVELTGRVLTYLGAKIDAVDRDGNGVVGLDEAQVKALIAEELAKSSKSDFVTANDVEAALASKATEIYNALDALETEFRDELNQMGVRVSVLEEEMQTVKADIAALKSDVEALKAQPDTSAAAMKEAQTAKTLGIVGIILGIAGCLL